MEKLDARVGRLTFKDPDSVEDTTDKADAGAVDRAGVDGMVDDMKDLVEFVVEYGKIEFKDREAT